MRRKTARTLLTLIVVALLLPLATPARADHTDPREPLAPAEGAPAEGITRGEGTWQHLRHFGPSPGSDVTFFASGGTTYAANGTLGQAPAGHVGQRITKLVDPDGTVSPAWVADHGSAACDVRSTSATGLQHDQFAVPPEDPELLVDTTDATGRCHDAPGGGIELVDVSGIDRPDFEPREVHLVRFDGLTHTATRDSRYPWIVYSNNSDFAGNNFLDFLDVRSCLTETAGGTLPDGATLEHKRAECRPLAYRIPFEPEWTQATLVEGGEPQGDSASCHDTVSDGDRLYCSGLNSEVVLDVADLVDGSGAVEGTPLDCTVTEGTDTGALVTDCAVGSGWDPATEVAGGWSLLGVFNHPGTNVGNTNTMVPSNRGVAVSHESRPTPSEVGSFLIVSDERGGGVVPGGASCTESELELGNAFGNGGLHFFTVSKDGDIAYAEMVDGGTVRRAVWQGEVVVPSATFCVVHRFRHLPDEQRIIMGYYSQGTKVLDYTIDENGRFHFTEVASQILPENVVWTTDVFKTLDNPDGTRTYYLMASDIARGTDVFTWTHTPNPIQHKRCAKLPPDAGEGARKGCPEHGGDDGGGLLPDPLLLGIAALPLAAFLGNRRRRPA